MHFISNVFKLIRLKSINGTILLNLLCTSEQTGATEHMWFEVLSIEDKGIQAKLANTPFEIPEMQMDEIYFMPSEQITDWIIYSTPLKNLQLHQIQFLN